jgi:hypothetical protein
LGFGYLSVYGSFWLPHSQVSYSWLLNFVCSWQWFFSVISTKIKADRKNVDADAMCCHSALVIKKPLIYYFGKVETPLTLYL